jgi:membrane associated rhomboid family serine protease
VYAIRRTALTASFTEDSCIKLLVDLAILAAISGPIEEIHDQLRMALFLVVVAVGSSLATAAFVFISFVITRWENLLFSVRTGVECE